MKAFYFVFLAATLTLLSSCSKDEDISNNTTSGWVVSKFIENTKDKTVSFDGYVFDFQSSGVATATKGSEVVTGIWKEVVDSGRTKFILDFAKSGIFDEISEDWTLVSKSDTSIKLTHTSGNTANIGTDILEFSK